MITTSSTTVPESVALATLGGGGGGGEPRLSFVGEPGFELAYMQLCSFSLYNCHCVM